MILIFGIFLLFRKIIELPDIENLFHKQNVLFLSSSVPKFTFSNVFLVPEGTYVTKAILPPGMYLKVFLFFKPFMALKSSFQPIRIRFEIQIKVILQIH